MKILLWILGGATRLIVKILLLLRMTEDEIYIGWTNFLKFLFSFRLDLEVEGVKNIPKFGSRLIVFNHTDALDAFVMPFAIPIVMYGWVANRHINIPFIAVYHAINRARPIKRGQRDKEATIWALDALKDGGLFAISPEGTRNRTGVLKPKSEIKWGPAYLAGKSGALIVPVGINGTVKGLSRVLNIFGPKVKVKVVIGKPYKIKESDYLLSFDLDGAGVKDSLQHVTVTQIMPRISELIEEKYRGEFA